MDFPGRSRSQRRSMPQSRHENTPVGQGYGCTTTRRLFDGSSSSGGGRVATEARSSTNSFYGQSSRARPTGSDILRSMESSSSPGRERDYWHPGQTIPISAVPVSDVDYLDDTTVPTGPREQNTDVMDMLRSFHTSMEKNLSSISGKLESIDGRMNKLENQQKNLEDEVRSNVSSMTTNVCAKSPHTRARVTPTSLQSKIRCVHAALDEDDQLNPSEPITGHHNSKVVREIVKAIGSDRFPEEIIRKGCRTYRKTIAERSKHTSTPVKRKKQERSRKQRNFERRGRVVKEGREASLWADVLPDMMSDEERVEDFYVRHPPSYRSKALSDFINKLETRLGKEKSTHPRLERRPGCAVEKPVPSRFKKWTIKKELRKSGSTTTLGDEQSDDSGDPEASDPEDRNVNSADGSPVY